MFNESKRKIVFVIMSLLIFVFIGIIGTIYTTTFHAVYINDQNLMQDFIENNIYERKASKEVHSDGNQIVKSLVFYAVSFNNDYEVDHIINDIKPVMSNDKLTNMAHEILNSGKSEGMSEEFIYRIIKDNDYTYVVFMNNAILKESVSASLKNIVIFGFILLIILFAASFKLADKIVSPLEETYKKQKQFISDAGHELKTPISTVNANIEILEREIGNNKWISNVKFENHRMQELVQQLLDLARTENISPVMESVNLSRIILGGILPFESFAFENGYMIESNIEDDVYIIGDARQLGQLISILTDNALSHAQGEGSISIVFKSERNMAVFSVSNPGKEIPLEKREKIFERFYRIDESRSLNCHYGLGLAIAKAIVNAHNGKLYVQCKEGITTFYAKIPRK